MKRLAFPLSLAVVLLCQDLFASAKTDSIVAFLGGAQAKLVWPRWAWCNDNYTPKSQAAATAEGKSLMLMDTRAGTERALVTGLKDVHTIRISRTGKWVTFIDGTTTYIIDLTAASATKNVLMSKSDCSYWAVNAQWIDPANGTEYVYCLDNSAYPTAGAGNGIYKAKLNSNGTVDRSTATKLTINGLSSGPYSVDESFGVSADGKKLGGAFPWPETKILDIPTGRLDGRHHEGFGCQANLAPDNSYRFFHCEGDHLGIYMFDANMVDVNWFVNLGFNLAGVHTTATVTAMDFAAPRWTNHVQYYTASYPMGDNYESYCGGDCSMEDNGSLWSKSASWVQNQINMLKVPKFFMGKFSSDFKTQEKSILIASDQRYMQYWGDGWICDGTTYGSQCTSVSTSPAIRGDHLRGLSVVQCGAFVNIEANGKATVHITDARGRLVRQVTGNGSISVDTRDLAIGAYVVSAHQQGNRLTRQVTAVW